MYTSCNDRTLLATPFEQFCGEPLANFSSVVAGNAPMFYGCYQRTIFILIPCVFVYLSSIYIFLANRQVTETPLTCTGLNAAKFTACGLMCLIWILRFVVTFVMDACIYNADYLSPLCMIIALRKGIPSSALTFFSWLLFVICGAPEFVDGITKLASGSQASPKIICFTIYFILAVIELVLLSFADKRTQDFVTEKNACPRDYASFLNRLIYAWFWKTAITGWKRSLVSDDLWNLSKSNRASFLLKQYEKYWCKNKKTDMHPAHTSIGVKFDSLKNAESKTKFETSHLYEPGQQRCPSIPWTLFLCFKGILIPATILNFCQVLLQFVSPQVLKILLNFVQDPTKPLWFDLAVSFLMFFSSLVQSLIQQQVMDRMFLFGMRLKTVLTETIYKKALRLSNNARRTSTVGEIVSHMAADVQRFIDTSNWIQTVWSTPLQMVLALYFLYQIMEWAALAGFAVVVILIPINFKLSRIQKGNQVAQMMWKDKRIKLMSEIFNGIRGLKLYAWEPPFEQQVMQIRAKELQVLRRAAIVTACNTFTIFCAPFFVAVVSFATYTLSNPDHILTPEVAFVSLSLFNILRQPLNMLPNIISDLVQTQVSNTRLKRFLSMEEIEGKSIDKTPGQPNAVTIEDGSFKWDRHSDKINLENINLTIKHGQMIAIVGQVGEGKSSLLSAILGEIEKVEGYVSLSGTVAYVPQQAWIRNTTLKQNVSFTKQHDETLYRRVVQACALEDDIALLPGGDETEIGEKGINLSGGQKQRVSLARAVYQDRDIYLLDDPLSAVDSHVGKHIFDNVLSSQGMLKNKTRILVTHGLACLKYMDNIVVLKDGKINEMGTFTQLIKSGGAFADFLDTYMLQMPRNPSEKGDKNELFNDPDIAEAAQIIQYKSIMYFILYLHVTLPVWCRKHSSTEKEKPRLSTQRSVETVETKLTPSPLKQAGDDKLRDERVAVGKVTWKVYQTYEEAVGLLACIGVFGFYTIAGAFNISTNLWLAAWSDANITTNNVNLGTRLGVYFALGITHGIFIFLATMLNAYATVSASTMFHKNILHNLVRVPMSFYDVTPLGAIINRVGKDVDIMDNNVPGCIRQWIMSCMNVLVH